ncbi:MAG: hypothetical protein ACJ0QU_00790 [Halobacteriales archaeon]
MGVLCIFGHSYGDVQRSEERNEQGREIVAVIQEYRMCSRCGKTRILSEHKEVSVDPMVEEDQEQKIEDIEMDLEEVVEESLEDSEKGSGVEFVEEDIEEWPEVAGEDEGFNAGLPDASIENIEFGGGLIPKSLREEEMEEEVVVEFPDQEEMELKFGEGEGEEIIGKIRGRRKDTQTVYVCGQCEYQTPVYESSLRKGDICPACRKGYIDEKLVERRFNKDRR